MKAKVRITCDSRYNDFHKGDVGYIVGYICGSDNTPYAVVVIGKSFSLVPLSAIELKEQKAINEEEMHKLYSIMEKSASVLGIGTKWFNENARQVAIEELRQEIRNYLSD